MKILRFLPIIVLFLLIVNTSSAQDVVIKRQIDVDTFDVSQTVVYGDLKISGYSFTDFSNLNQIDTIYGELIIDKFGHSVFPEFPSLKYVGAHFFIGNCGTISDVIGFEELNHVGGELIIQQNLRLKNMPLFPKLISTSGIRIERNKSLKDLPSFISITDIHGDLIIGNNDSLNSISGFSNLKNVDDAFWLFRNYSLSDVRGFTHLTHVSGNFWIDNNTELKSLDPFGQLNFVGDFLWIWNNSVLENLDGLAGLQSVYGDFKIQDNFSLTNCCGIHQLLSSDSIKGSVVIENNPAECSSEQEVLELCSGDRLSVLGTVYFNPIDTLCDSTNTTVPYLKFNVLKDGQEFLTRFTNGNGNYRLTLKEDGDYQILPDYLDTLYFISPSEYVVTKPSSNLIVRDFCISPKELLHDVEISMIPKGYARPGFSSEYIVQIKNVGTTVQSGTIDLMLQNPDELTYVRSEPEVEEVLGAKYQWSFSDLFPFEEERYFITFKLNSPLDDPPLNQGDQLKYEAIVSGYEPDVNPSNNVFELTQEVVNSFDPNDKQCLEGGILGPEKIGDFVHFKIRFENTGNASAINIKVCDSIDTEMFDIESLKIVEASHEVETEVKGSVINFYFNDIYLSHEDDVNDGYVVFKIKVNEDRKVGDVLTNFADIYFDFNPAITTDDAVMELKVLAVEDHIDLHVEVSVSPNPANGLVRIETNASKSHQVRIRDVNGIVQFVSELKSGKSHLVNTQNWTSGIYVVELIDQNQVLGSRLLHVMH